MRLKRSAVLLSVLVLTLAGCAGGGARNAAVDTTLAVPAGASRVVVKLRTTGTLPAGKKIGGVSAQLNYVSGKGLSISPTGVEASGAGAGATLVANTTNEGKVVLGLITVDGIAAGEFATLSFRVGKVNFPTDFSVAKASVIDTATQTLDGVGVSIASVTVE